MNPPKMPLHIGDYRRDTGHLRAAGHGAYLLLMMHYWSTGSLPDDDEQLSAIACMSRAEWRRHRPIIERFFKPGWKHSRIDADLEAAKASYERRAKAGQSGGKAKASGKQCSSIATTLLEQPLTFKEEKKDAASRPSEAESAPLPKVAQAESMLFEAGQLMTQEAHLFRAGKELLGPKSGGLIAKLLKTKKGVVPLARAAIEIASTKENPREYLAAICAGGNASEDGRRLTNDEQYYGVGRTPGII